MEQLERDAPAKLREWQDAIKSLFSTLAKYLEEQASDGMLSLSQEPLTLHEDLVGQYEVPVLHVKAPSSSVVFTPGGLFIIGAKGRIDMTVQGRGTQSEKYSLLRRLDANSDAVTWLISCPPARAVPNQIVQVGSYEFMPLTKQSFEAAMENILV